MKKKHKLLFVLLLVFTLMFVCFITVFYIRQLNRTISDNTIRSISEIAEHDKAAIQSYINICWDDLQEIQERFASDQCKTVEDIETRLNRESATSGFTHIYLLAEDGTVYTDEFTTYIPGVSPLNKNLDFLPCFNNNKEQIIIRFDDENLNGQVINENVLYGIRLKDFQIEGASMLALIGISDISSIQSSMVIDSFIKNGQSRGHSALIDMEGNYIININKEIYLNKRNNLFEHLSESASSELTNVEVKQKFDNLETFGFYHSHAGEKNRELFYLIPLKNEMNLYFIMSVNEAVFMEQSRPLITLSMVMLITSMLAVVSMLLVVMNYQTKTIRASEKAKAQKDFLSNMSHEIRTPLNGLIGINHLIMVHINDDSQKPQIKEWLKKSQSTANYLLSLVNDILDMSKLQAGKVDLIHAPLLVSALVDEISAMQTDNITSRGINFIVEKDIVEPCIEGDATRIKQILMNILGNAAKFTPQGKDICFSVRQEKSDSNHIVTIFQCKDTGIGMSKEYLDKIFDSFSQEHTKNTVGIKGTGLGMAISKLLANAMGGDITVESELDAGSTFTITIPSLIVKEIPDYLKEETMPPAAVNEAFAPAESHTPLKILIVEDVDLNAEILSEILCLEGFDTAHACNGKEAVEIFEKSAVHEFDIILMDMQMPVMDGCTASFKIRNLNRADARTVTIYACTANSFQEDRDMAIKSGMNDFLTKPIDINILLKKINQIHIKG